MLPPVRLALGLLICLAVWRFVLRQGACAGAWPGRQPIAAGLDMAPVLVGFAAGLGALARPLLAGLAVAALAGGLSLADRVKRAVLLEPVVFADRAELLEVVRHPRLYLPFAGSGFVLGGAGVAIAAAIATLAWLEPPLWDRSVAAALAEAVIAGLAIWGSLHITSIWPGLVDRVAAVYTARLAPTRDPAQDAARFGPLATLIVHATVAHSERPGNRARAAAVPAMVFPDSGGPVVLVQAESFMDPGRLHPALAGLLPAFAVRSVQRGCLDVPAWGANTVRSEFAVLSGIAEQVLGLDLYNPYESFVSADLVLPSLPSMARAAGYRTVFVHPFDLGFYGRSRVLPRLGFDELIGPAAFAGAAKRGAYVGDEAIAPVVADVLRRHGPRTMIFAATMEAHGPWSNTGGGPRLPIPDALQGTADSGQLGRWLWHLQGTDRMLGILQQMVAVQSGWLAVYGDHQPSLPGVFAAAGLADRRTNYAIWGSAPGPERSLDLEAHRLGAELVAAIGLRADTHATAQSA